MRLRNWFSWRIPWSLVRLKQQDLSLHNSFPQMTKKCNWPCDVGWFWPVSFPIFPSGSIYRLDFLLFDLGFVLYWEEDNSEYFVWTVLEKQRWENSSWGRLMSLCVLWGVLEKQMGYSFLSIDWEEVTSFILTPNWP